jgi:hypothetical protein
MYPGWLAAFQTLVGSRGIPPAERVHYLRRYLGGPAKEAVEGFLLLSSDTAYSKAMELLEKRYGNSFTVAGAFRDKLDSWPKIAPRDGPGLQKFADYLYQCTVAMQANASLSVLNDERENKRLLSKLPDWLVSRWGRIVVNSRQTQGIFPEFEKFAKFIAGEAEIANDPVTALPPGRTTESAERKPKRPEKRQAGTYKTAASESTPTCPFCSAKSHCLNECNKFKSIILDERVKFVMVNSLCFGCLTEGHISRECKARLTCDICSRRHPSCLHAGEVPKSTNTESKSQETKAHNASTRNGGARSCTAKASMIVPVLVSHSDEPNKCHGGC